MPIHDSTTTVRQAVDTLSTGAKHRTGQPTPREILSWLPKDATPEQQDSAIQANIKPVKIRWSNQPDTLHLPGHPVGKSYRDAKLPKYYKESFFSNDPFYHPELPAGRPGVAGDPVPYTIAGDNLITSLLLACFILGCTAFAQSRSFIARQLKHFFHVRNAGTSDISETSGEIWFQIFLCLQTSLLLAILYFLYIRASQGDTFIYEQYKVIGVIGIIISGYFIIKVFISWVVSLTFFDKRRNAEWFKSFLFLTAFEGVLLLPLVMLQAYFQLSTEKSLLYAGTVIVVGKLLSLYKSYLIFFSQRRAFLHFFLYFCALEIVPLSALWGILTIAANYLKINF